MKRMKKIFLKIKLKQKYSIIINGKEISNKILEKIKVQVQKLKQEYNEVPGLAVILVGNREDSLIYVNQKKKKSIMVGFQSFETKLPENITEEKLLEIIQSYNQNKNIHGILVQLPRK
jgi:methylenetetrahydrofolate dehydrogenase (NADP+) / methenyltetrahydrofolate cyclohydrolase